MIFTRSEENAALLQSLLEKEGVRLLEWVASGVNWADAWTKHKPQLIIVDLHLPRRDGLFCLEKLRGLDPDCNVILTHAYLGQMANQLEILALAKGAEAVLQRPFTAARFSNTLARVARKVAMS